MSGSSSATHLPAPHELSFELPGILAMGAFIIAMLNAMYEEKTGVCKSMPMMLSAGLSGRSFP